MLVKAPAAEATEPEWTVEELQSAKPVMVYFYVDGLTQKSDDDSFKFASTWEQGCLVDKVVDEVNAQWVSRKVGLDIEADRKLEKNQARIEFWSFTKVKMATISVTERNLLNPGPFKAMLKKYELKNEALCMKEIKRIEAADKAIKDLVKKDEKAAAK